MPGLFVLSQSTMLLCYDFLSIEAVSKEVSKIIYSFAYDAVIVFDALFFKHLVSRALVPMPFLILQPSPAG